MPTRISVFPITFGVCLLALSAAYSYRKSFYGEVWEKQKKDFIEGKVQAAQFQADFKEKLDKEKLK